MKNIREFLLYSSGVNRTILKRCPSDEERYVAIGAAVFFTGLLAFISASYALHMVFNSYVIAVVLGLIWGLMIYNLDRFIVLSLRSSGSAWRDSLLATPRIILALIFAVVISTPLELRIFQNEVESELVLMNQEQILGQKDEITSRFKTERGDLLETRTQIESELATVRAKRDELDLIALKEADGSGGSMKKNLGPIYKAKKEAADKLSTELAEKSKSAQPLISNIETSLTENLKQESQSLAELEHVEINGLIGRLEALSRLTSKSGMIMTAHLFIFLLFIALELAPVMVKLLSLNSPYDLLLSGHEQAFRTIYNVKTHKANSEMQESIEVNGTIISHRTTTTIAAEKAILDQKLKERLQKVKEGTSGWDKAFG